MATATLIVIVIVGAVLTCSCVYVIELARRAKELVKYKLRRAAVALLLYGFGIALWRSLGHPWGECVVLGFLLGLTPLGFMRPPRRTRRVPAGLWRAVIERDRPHGEAYDPEKHHMHHELAFKRGGDHSLTNLRLVSKEENLRKGSRLPGFLELLGYRRLVVIVLTVSFVGWVAYQLQNHAGPAGQPTPNSAAVAESSTGAPVVAPMQSPLPSPPPPPLLAPPSAPPEGAASGHLRNADTLTSTSQRSRREPLSSPLPVDPDASAEPSTATSMASAPPRSEPPGAPLRYTVSELLAAYKTNKREADRLLRGRTVEVSGTVRKIGKDEVQLREPADTDPVKCRSTHKAPFDEMGLAVGATVAVRGQVKGRGLAGNITLDHCEILPSPSP